MTDGKGLGKALKACKHQSERVNSSRLVISIDRKQVADFLFRRTRVKSLL